MERVRNTMGGIADTGREQTTLLVVLALVALAFIYLILRRR